MGLPLNNYQKMCYRWFGRVAENTSSEKLALDLEKAHINMRVAAYLTFVWVTTLVVGVVTSVVIFSLILFMGINILISTLFIILIPIFTVLGYQLLMKLPNFKAKSRSKEIDLHLPYALNFISAMSAAGVTPTEIFRSLSKQRIYGEIREEALWIYRDVELLGKDIISAIKANIKRTPSNKFKEFLQGAIVTVQSGGALKTYFMGKAEQYTRENRVAQKQMIENLGIMAEAYVSAAVAGVLMILVVIPILMIISGVVSQQIVYMYIFIVVVIPLIHIGFAVILSSMISKV